MRYFILDPKETFLMNSMSTDLSDYRMIHGKVSALGTIAVSTALDLSSICQEITLDQYENWE